MLKLVKFSCGCIGTPPEEGKTIKVYDCRGDQTLPKYSFTGQMEDITEIYWGTPRTKFCKPLGPEHTKMIILELGRVVSDAVRYRDIRSALCISAQGIKD